MTLIIISIIIAVIILPFVENPFDGINKGDFK